MGRLEVALVPNEVRPRDLRGRFVAVVDVLRAGTSVALALANGATRVVPVASVRGAREISRALAGEPVLLCGERRGIRLPGFDLGNSPREYTRENVAGRTIVFTSSNATQALARAREAEELVLAALTNGARVVQKAVASGLPVTVLCAGRLGRFGVEDFLAAGFLAEGIRAALRLDDRDLNDAARLAIDFAAAHEGDILAVLESSDHGRALRKAGFADDLPICARLNTVDVLPVLKGDSLVAG